MTRQPHFGQSTGGQERVRQRTLHFLDRLFSVAPRLDAAPAFVQVGAAVVLLEAARLADVFLAEADDEIADDVLAVLRANV